MHASAPLILAVDDDAVVRRLISHIFDSAGLKVEVFERARDLEATVTGETLACLVDLKMPDRDGLECLAAIKAKHPAVEVIILTTINQAKEAIAAMKEGAFDYITKPFDPDELLLSVRKAIQLARATRDARALRQSLGDGSVPGNVLGQSEAMKHLFAVLPRVAPSDNPVLLTGASGTGKGVFARAIHNQSPRASQSFVPVSCPSLPKDLLESEMFGHEKGAFSGATTRRLGRAELADGGTLFLDEIGEMPLELQPKLLTFLQDRTFFRVGGEKLIQSDVRVIAATNLNLRDQVDRGNFREDLYFRLNVLPMEMPSLRDRADDIPLLAEYFLQRAASRETPDLTVRFAKEVIRALRRHPWPGNVRELENAIERAFTLRQDATTVTLADLPPEVAGLAAPSYKEGSGAILAGMTLREIEQIALAETLKSCGGNKAEAARSLGITEKSVYNKMKRFGMM